MQTHITAAEGFQVGADDYDKSRPRYPQEALDFLNTLLPTSPLAVLDLGAGTGIMTRLLYQQGRYEITAVEPVDAMRAKIDVPVVTLKGTAWSIPVPSASQDVVMLAQCFHWFDDLQSLQEIHRVLKPGGYVVLIWNMESRERSTWVDRLRTLYEAFDETAPQYRKGNWKKVFETDEARQWYALPLRHQRFVYDIETTISAIWPRILSKSYIAILDEEQKKELHAEIVKVLEEELSNQSTVVYPHDTDMYWCQKK